MGVRITVIDVGNVAHTECFLGCTGMSRNRWLAQRRSVYMHFDEPSVSDGDAHVVARQEILERQ